MLKVGILFFTLCILASCSSVEKYNKQLSASKTEAQLRSDVDYVYRKLQKLHPHLYWYISKKELDNKFDSLKASIRTPMTSEDFYFKLSPVIASIKQGHDQVAPPIRMLNKKELRETSGSGATPFSKFEFEMFDNHLYIINNYKGDSTIKCGTELVAVDSIRPQTIISKYKYSFASDGYNQTYLLWAQARGFPKYYYYINGIKDSVLCHLKYRDSTWTAWLKRKNPVSPKEKPIKLKASKKEEAKKEKKKRVIQGYNSTTKKYSKSLRFWGPDSSTAVIKIEDFTKGVFTTFYKNSFKLLNAAKTKTLIIDIRNNGGGRLSDAFDLYTYLADTTFQFVNNYEVTSQTSLLQNDYLRGKTRVEQIGFLCTAPFRLLMCSRVRRDDNNHYYYTCKNTKPAHPKKLGFKGPVYVLINGGSFSASCLLSSNLKGTKRAIFVGEETGGAYNGTVAGWTPPLTLPASKIKVRVGLCLIKTPFVSYIDGRGIFPDMEIKPSLIDRMNRVDPLLNWVLEDVKAKHTALCSDK